MTGGPAPSVHQTACTWLVTSGSAHVDQNQAAIFGDATNGDVRDLVDRILQTELPVLLACSDGVGERAAPLLSDAGFAQLPTREHLFWMSGVPDRLPSRPFEVRELESGSDLAAMASIFEAVHGYSRSETEVMYGPSLRGNGDLTGWLAWDGSEAVSFAIVTRAESSLSLFEVMTPDRHRRRGAGRTVITEALAATAERSEQSILETMFWSTPAGRPLYESLGFSVADTIDAWVLGAEPIDLASVGA
jgi:GNAT superfamily N-acetyltransferase